MSETSMHPDGREWAEAPLLREENVGKYVWLTHNHNAKYASPVKIVKIGRTNIHLDNFRSRPDSLRVSENGSMASGIDGSGYGLDCMTNGWRHELEVRWELIREIEGQGRKNNWRDVPTDTLRAIVELIQEAS